MSPHSKASQACRNSNARCLAWEARGLTGALLCFARNHNWHEPGHITNKLKLRLAFKKPIRAATNTLLARGRDGLAEQVKADFFKLQEMVRALDRLCVKRIDKEDELVMLEHTKAHLTESLSELAELLETSQRPSRKGTEIPPESDEGQWITVSEAADITGVHKGTISRWIREGKIPTNGKKGRHRRVSKTAVLLLKQAREDKELKQDIEDLRKDAKRIK